MTALAPSTGTYHQRFKTPLERLREKYVVNLETACWEWQGAMKASGDYGIFNLDGRMMGAHRAAYLLLVGAIPEGLVLDHLCRTPGCVNPAHLEPVTQAENRLRQRVRQTHCRNNHPLSGENLRLVRVCITCADAAEHRHIAKKRRERNHG